MSRVWSPPLTAGDMVGVIAPSGPVDPARLARGITLVESWGMAVRVAPHVVGTGPVPYLSAADVDRAGDLQQLWCDPDVRAVWAARGGYGAQRIIDLLDLDAFRAAGPKRLIGFSDVTALHARLGRALDLVTIHGPGLASTEQLVDRASYLALRDLLLTGPTSGQFLAGGRMLVAGNARGVLAGGNLSLIAADVGIEPAPIQPTILLLEEVNEPAYRIDRMLTQLLRSGWLDQVVGVAVGELGLPDDSLVLDRLGGLGVPIVAGLPVGHGARNLALPLGADVRLKGFGDEGLLTLA